MEANTEGFSNQPFHVEFRDYTNSELLLIRKFMEEDTYPSFSIPRGSRDGKFVVEMPSVPEADDFKDLMLSEIPDEIQSCHPLLRRRDIFVRFVSDLREQQGVKSTGTGCDVLDVSENGKIKYYIRVGMSSLFDTHGDDLVANLAGKIVHEIAETDYYLKSQEGLEDSKALLGHKEYNFTEDEEVANRRALRVLKRKYPKTEWIGVHYPADK